MLTHSVVQVLVRDDPRQIGEYFITIFYIHDRCEGSGQFLILRSMKAEFGPELRSHWVAPP